MTVIGVTLWSTYRPVSIEKPGDTVGEFKSAEMGVPHMPAWKAKTLGKLTQERVLLEP
jgi:hypothetical protein